MVEGPGHGPVASAALADLRAETDGRPDRPDWLAATDEPLRDRLDALAAELAGADETPAAAYERALGADERAASGHFRTHPGIATALCRWAVRPRADRLPRVLDPATGSGVFAAAALQRLNELAPSAPPARRVERVVGVDVDPAPLALTARRLLAAVPPGTDPTLHLYESDFFDVVPGGERAAEDDRVADGEVTVEGGTVRAGQFDAVVGNPPYVRQESLDTDRARAHLASFGPDGKTPYLDGARALSRRSDAYVYFLTHATRFLRPGGRLAVVVPTKWLVARYGGPVQAFLHDHYDVAAVVGFGSRAFGDALVDASLLVATRREPRRRADAPAPGDRPPVRFLRLDEQVTVDRLLELLPGETPAGECERPVVRAGEDHRAVDVPATRLGSGTDKLGHYLAAPAPLVELREDPSLVPLETFATVSRGVMTGANDFFFLAADGATTDVDDRFLTPAIKSIRDVPGRALTAADTDRYLLDVHDYVQSVRSSRDDPDLEAAVKAALERDGYDGLRAYVARGERDGYHERRSCASRRVWFDLGDCRPPAVFVPKFFDERVLVPANPDGLLASNAVDCLYPAEDVDRRVLLGVLNSTVTTALLECWGRSEGGGALQVMTYELASLPVPDLRTFDVATREAVRAATDDLLAGDTDALARLDELVLGAVDCDLSPERLRECRERMVRRRVDTADTTVPPVVKG